MRSVLMHVMSWFSGLEIAICRACIELKMLYQPLTKTQEEKYRSFCQAKDDRAGLTHIDVEEMARAGRPCMIRSQFQK